MFANMNHYRTSSLQLVGLAIFIRGLHAEIITTRYNITEDCVFPSVDIAAIAIATFIHTRGEIRCAAECLANVQCTGYLLEKGNNGQKIHYPPANHHTIHL